MPKKSASKGTSKKASKDDMPMMKKGAMKKPVHRPMKVYV